MRRREKISDGLRFRVLSRDGFRCRYCGAHGSETQLQIDHVVPVTAGGKNHERNLVTACKSCNSGKRAKTLEESPCLVASPGECLRNIDDPWIADLDFEDIAGWWQCTRLSFIQNPWDREACS